MRSAQTVPSAAGARDLVAGFFTRRGERLDPERVFAHAYTDTGLDD